MCSRSEVILYPWHREAGHGFCLRLHLSRSSKCMKWAKTETQKNRNEMTFVRNLRAVEGWGACYLQRMHHSDRGINKIVQFSNIRTQQRIICAQFMFMPPQSPHSSLHKSQELECRDDNIVQATSELQHSWIWYEATFCDKKYPGPGSRNPAPGRLRRPRHAMDNSSEHNYNYICREDSKWNKKTIRLALLVMYINEDVIEPLKSQFEHR